MTFTITILILTAFFCALVAGFLFAFAVVVMPGIKKLNDRAFIEGFQVIDGVIQKNQPLFMLLWLGSVILYIAALVTGINQLEGLNLELLIASTLVYFSGVQLPTILVNVPLNNQLQKIDTKNSSAKEIKTARLTFEKSWNRSNRIRTLLACLSAAILIFLVFLI